MSTFRPLSLLVAPLSISALSGCSHAHSAKLLPTTQVCEPAGAPTIVCYSTNPKLPSGSTGYGPPYWGDVYYIKSGDIPEGYRRLKFARFEVLGPQPVVCDLNNRTVSGYHARCNLNTVNDHVVVFSYQIEGIANGVVVTTNGLAGPTDGVPHPAFKPLQWTEEHDGRVLEPAVIILTYEK